MKLFSKLCNGWQEIRDIPPDIQNENIHSLMLFSEPKCPVQCTPESITTTAFILNLKTNEIEFKRDTDENRVKGLLCHITIYTPYTNDLGPEYKIKIHCQTNENHSEFIMPNSCVVFDDDELCPENPDELVTLISTTHNEITSEADQETNAATVTPAQEQLRILLKNLESNKRLFISSQISAIPISKIHLNLSRRRLCPPLVKEIRRLFESKLLDFRSIVLIVTKHPTIADNYEIADGNQTMGAILEMQQSRQPVPQSLKCKVFERNDQYGALEIGLTSTTSSKEHPLSYMEKVSVIRNELEKNNICRASVTKKTIAELKKLYNYLFPSEKMPQSLSFFIGIPLDIFEICLTTATKFTSDEICYAVKKGVQFCPAPYKHGTIKVLNPEAFWLAFSQSYRKNSTFSIDILKKLSLTYSIEDALKDFKTTVSDFQQQLQNSGVKYNGSFQDAITAFNLPQTITQEQAHFLLTNRSIQKLLTRQDNFDIEKAKQNIATFLDTVNSIQFEHVEDVTDIQNYQLIICFEHIEWSTYTLPPNCLILDLCKNNDENLGQEIPVLWNIQLQTKKYQKPENGKLPIVTNQVRLFLLLEDAHKNLDTVFAHVQQKSEEKSIEVGNYMDMTDISSLFKFCDDKSTCLFYEPPMEWIDLIISSAVKEIKECQKITILSRNPNIAARCKEVVSKCMTAKWQEKADAPSTTPKSRKRKTKSTSAQPPSIPASPVPPSLPTTQNAD